MVSKPEYDLIDLAVVQKDSADPARWLLPKSLDANGRVLGNKVDDAGVDVPFLTASPGGNDLPRIDRALRVITLDRSDRLIGRSMRPEAPRAGAWHAGAWAELPLPEPLVEECAGSFAGASHEAGQVAGWMRLHDGAALPLLWDDQGVRVLPPIGELTHAYPVSVLDDGSIAGEARGCCGGHYPIVWRNGVADLLPAPNTYARVLASSASRPAHLGSAWNGHRFEAAIWLDHRCDLLPALPGEAIEAAAFGLNRADTAVGVTWGSPKRPDWVATRWQHGYASDLNHLIAPHPGVHLVSANAINDAGQIAAAAIWSDGSLHVVRLDPR